MWIISVFVCFSMAVGGYAILNRLVRRGSFVVKYLLCGGVSGIALTGELLWRHGVALETWAALLLYACVSEFYLFVCALVTSSVSVSLLIALRRRSLARNEIDRLCSPATMVADRFDWLVANGFLERRHSGYRLTKRGQIVVVVFGRLRRFFRLERTVGSGNRAAG
jgi:hypothetical protein